MFKKMVLTSFSVSYVMNYGGCSCEKRNNKINRITGSNGYNYISPIEEDNIKMYEDNIKKLEERNKELKKDIEILNSDILKTLLDIVSFTGKLGNSISKIEKNRNKLDELKANILKNEGAKEIDPTDLLLKKTVKSNFNNLLLHNSVSYLNKEKEEDKNVKDIKINDNKRNDISDLRRKIDNYNSRVSVYNKSLDNIKADIEKYKINDKALKEKDEKLKDKQKELENNNKQIQDYKDMINKFNTSKNNSEYIKSNKNILSNIGKNTETLVR